MSALSALLTFVAATNALQTRPAGPVQREASDAEGHRWWQHAVFYEIYPRSFADDNSDGIGDLDGITSKLAYLQDLGVDAIWITPCFPSPQVDFGYDVADYEDIEPSYGTLASFDRLVAEANHHHIKVILDLVLNHTSDQHRWFKDSRSSRTASHRDWYIWREGKPGPEPPNNWTSTFGGSAWTFDTRTAQYYYHFFYPEQPDLNWRNPSVEQAMLDVTRWWYRRGVAGFRLDAVDTLFESPLLTDNPVLPGSNGFGDPVESYLYNRRLPEVHTVLKRLRGVADKSDAVLIGETWTDDADQLRQYYGEHGDELQLPMDLMFATVDRLSPQEFRHQVAAVDGSGGWPVFVIGNHDRVRSYDRYGDGRNNDAIAKLMAAFYLTLRGTAIMYYGEEIGMTNHDPQRKEDVKDPIGRKGWPREKGRDGERTPMQWSNGANAGFSTASPWLAVADNYRTHNVASERKDPGSILNLYREVLSLRRANVALREGSYAPLNEDDPNVLSYLRVFGDEAVLVALNMSGAPRTVRFNLPRQDFQSRHLRSLIRTQRSSANGTLVSLGPFGALIAELAK